MLPTTMLFMVLAIPTHPLYDSRIDRARFPNNDAVGEMLRQNSLFIKYAENNESLAMTPAAREYWHDAAGEANQIRNWLWIFYCGYPAPLDSPPIEDNQVFWDHWMKRAREELPPEWYASGFLPAFPYWRCQWIER